MSLWGTTNDAVFLRFPRVSGDEPFRDAMSQGQITFSPRERG